MSVHALACVLGDGRRDGNPSKSASEGSARLVLLAIANYANDYGMCWPKVVELAPAANVHRGTVNRNLDELIKLGELRMFRRGHYQSPAFVMTIVDHPLSTQEIVDRLVEIDDRAEWRERIIDRSSGEALEVPVPTQGALTLTRSSQIATISENHTSVSNEPRSQASDQGIQHDRGRENGQKPASDEIVADRDDLPEIVASREEIVASGAEIVAMARRSSEPSVNHQEPRARRLADSIESELRQLAYRKAKTKGAHNVEGLAQKILTEDRDLLEAELLEAKAAAARDSAIARCLICDTKGFAWEDEEGQPVGHADQAAHTARVCGHQPREGEPPATDVRPVQPTSEGSPTGGAFPCTGCGDPADIEVAGQGACINCFAASLGAVT